MNGLCIFESFTNKYYNSSNCPTSPSTYIFSRILQTIRQKNLTFYPYLGSESYFEKQSRSRGSGGLHRNRGRGMQWVKYKNSGITRIFIINKNMQIQNFSQTNEYIIPVPVSLNQLDQLIFSIQMPSSKMSLPNEQIRGDPGAEIITCRENRQQISCSETKITRQFDSFDKKSDESSFPSIHTTYSKTQFKNVLMNVRKPIAQYLKRFKSEEYSKNQSFLKFQSSSFVNLALYKEFFQDKTLKNALCQMFLSNYLKRAYQQKRTKKENKIRHLYRIRQLEKMFIETQKK